MEFFTYIGIAVVAVVAINIIIAIPTLIRTITLIVEHAEQVRMNEHEDMLMEINALKHPQHPDH